ncbi:MAG: glycogen debranching enzyme N-terminal domain-containing protein [Acidobacteria bacterium]|nr:glycogen debranching enzyme N-terminal domain-containing protein [Acidobacteriota bacterium]
MFLGLRRNIPNGWDGAEPTENEGPVILFSREVCGNPEAALEREWLETNGLGGFSSSTIIGLNTRRYHGLLTAATKPPVGRFVLLSKLEETLVVEGQRFDLSANRYPGVVHPQGYQYQTGFRLDPFPVFTYKVGGIEIEKSVFMVYGENTTVVQYEIHGLAPNCLLEVRPLIAFRDYHSTTHANGALNREVERESGLATIAPYQGLPALHFAHDADEVDPVGVWYRNLEYDIERERGLDYQEDLFNPLVLTFNLNHRRSAAVIASTEKRDIRSVAGMRRAEVERRTAVLQASPCDDPLVRALVAAADQFIVARGDQKTIIAGYHWFSDWGRDTMIALPGLTLLTGGAEVAKSILLAFAAHVDRGMLPNRFPDAGEEPEYNTVDATLWFFEAVRALLKYTDDYGFVRTHLYEVLVGIIEWHVRGARYGIRVDEDGLLASGEPGVQLTWMDAKVGDWVVTPRHGKAVEIQALWYNAVRIMEGLARRFDDEAGRERYVCLGTLAKASFNRKFWNEAAGCLYDVVNGEARDASIRPNQIFAVSLPYTMLPLEKTRRVVEVVERELLTPYGLRSLAPGDPQYRGRYEGDPWSRDSAYHQGTVWAWLMGPFITAYAKVNRRSQAARRRAADWLAAFHGHLSGGG